MASSDQDARRAYWTGQMEQAYEFMQLMREYPVQECGEPMASMPDAVKASGVEVEFSTIVPQDLDRIYYLRAGLIDGFIDAAREMNERGWVMKIVTGFRSVEIQTRLARRPQTFDGILKTTIWELGGQIPSPEFMLRRVGALIAVRPKVGTHMSGSAIDISVLNRDDGSIVDRGGEFVMSEITPMSSPFVSPEAQQNRQAITEIMVRHGFAAYPYEYWHYNSGDCYTEFLTNSRQPARYGAIHFNREDGSIAPIEDVDGLLLTPEEIEAEIEQSLHRLQAA